MTVLSAPWVSRPSPHQILETLLELCNGGSGGPDKQEEKRLAGSPVEG